MQLTNIARDVHEDAVAGRRYVPATWWDAAPEDIAHPSPDMQRDGAQAVLRLLDLADGYYAIAQGGFAFLPLSSRIGLAVAARVYRGIGTELRRRGGAFHQGRVYVPRWRKAVLTVAATGALVLFLAASMASQAARLLIQADIIPSLAAPIWNTSHLLSQDTLAGTILHGLIGYDEEPAGMQVVAYVGVLMAIGTCMLWVSRRASQAQPR